MAGIEAAIQKIAEDLAACEKRGHYAWLIESDATQVGTIGAYGFEDDISNIEIGGG